MTTIYTEFQTVLSGKTEKDHWTRTEQKIAAKKIHSIFFSKRKKINKYTNR